MLPESETLMPPTDAVRDWHRYTRPTRLLLRGLNAKGRGGTPDDLAGGSLVVERNLAFMF